MKRIDTRVFFEIANRIGENIRKTPFKNKVDIINLIIINEVWSAVNTSINSTLWDT